MSARFGFYAHCARRAKLHSSSVDSDGTRQVESSQTMLPNKSPEPTAVGAGRSAIAVHAASRRWLSFFR